MPAHEDPPPTALAHGPAKSTDIEQCRQDIDKATKVVAADEKVSAARRLQEVHDREVEAKRHARP
jgi:hypothetical protein